MATLSTHSTRSTSKHSVVFAGTTIQTTVTNEAATVTEWVRQITAHYGHSPAVVGLDIEWLPNTSSFMSNPPATLQLCIGRNCLILQLLYMDFIPNSIKSFLMNPNFTFVGVEVEDDVQKLKSVYGLDCFCCADIREAAMGWWLGKYQKPGLKDLAREVCGMVMEKPLHVTRSPWNARVLSKAQIDYGCIDAFASYRIGHKLFIEK